MLSLNALEDSFDLPNEPESILRDACCVLRGSLGRYTERATRNTFHKLSWPSISHFMGGSSHDADSQIFSDSTAETTVGKLTVVNCHADSTFNSFASDICLNNASGQIKASSVLGNIEAESIVSSALFWETTSGGISAECLPLIGGEHRIRTISGDIHLAISDLADCSLWAKVEDGKLQVELPMEVIKKSGNHLFANLRKGRAALTVESKTGLIKIGKKD